MIPVEQKLDYDCLVACLASIFEIPYENIPRFTYKNGNPIRRWSMIYDNWLYSLGWARLERVLQKGDKKNSQNSPWHFPGYWIATVKSPRYDGSHAVVMLGGQIAYDPNPKRHMGHLGFEGAEYFLPLDPARFTYIPKG